MSRQTKECSIQDIKPELRQKIMLYIPKGEKVRACYETTEGIGIGLAVVTIASLGLMGIPRKSIFAYIITDTLLIQSECGERDSVATILLSDIKKIDQYHTEGGHIVAAKGQGPTDGVYCRFASKQVAQKFSHTLGEAIQQVKLTPSGTFDRDGIDSIEDRLQKLGRLKESGLISDAEFEQKRKEILDRL